MPILDQGKVWACTGFALATIAHYLLRRRKIHPDKSRVSPAMMFEMARRYDDYTGENIRIERARRHERLVPARRLHRAALAVAGTQAVGA